jgi:transcriptional regulator ATRX
LPVLRQNAEVRKVTAAAAAGGASAGSASAGGAGIGTSSSSNSGSAQPPPPPPPPLLKTALLLAPVNTLANWEAEFAKWLPHAERVKVYSLAASGPGSGSGSGSGGGGGGGMGGGGATAKQRQAVGVLRQWQRTGGVLVAGYESFRGLCAAAEKKAAAAGGGGGGMWRAQIRQALVDPGPDLLVADEAHVLRNFKSGLAQALAAVRTRRRLALTGSPLQVPENRDTPPRSPEGALGCVCWRSPLAPARSSE